MNVEARLVGRRVHLRPLEPTDYPALRRVELSEALAFRWRLGGVHVPPEEFSQSLWSDALAHFIVINRVNGEAIGFVSAYNANHVNGTVFLAAASFSLHREVGSRILGAIGLLIDYVFAGWPFRKAYFEAADFNLRQFERAVGWLLVEEGRLRQHVFLDGAYHDLVTLALWRSTWATQRGAIVRFA